MYIGAAVEQVAQVQEEMAGKAVNEDKAVVWGEALEPAVEAEAGS